MFVYLSNTSVGSETCTKNRYIINLVFLNHEATCVVAITTVGDASALDVAISLHL